MKLKLRLVTNKPIPIATDYTKVYDPSVATLELSEYTEKIVEAKFTMFPNTNLEILKREIRYNIDSEYPNITSIEGLEELKLLKE